MGGEWQFHWFQPLVQSLPSTPKSHFGSAQQSQRLPRRTVSMSLADPPTPQSTKRVQVSQPLLSFESLLSPFSYLCSPSPSFSLSSIRRLAVVLRHSRGANSLNLLPQEAFHFHLITGSTKRSAHPQRRDKDSYNPPLLWLGLVYSLGLSSFLVFCWLRARRWMKPV